ncbi:MAG: hypothetical protein ACRDOE_05445, partial [Streptosporangiaceae bacterium]
GNPCMVAGSIDAIQLEAAGAQAQATFNYANRQILLGRLRSNAISWFFKNHWKSIAIQAGIAALAVATNPSPHANAPHVHIQTVPGKRGGRGDLPHRREPGDPGYFLPVRLLLAPAPSLPPSACVLSALPEPAQKYIHARVPAWRLVAVADLNPVDESTWRGYFGSRACPGLVTGRFDGGKEELYAITLFRRDRLKQEQLLLVGRVEDGHFAASTLVEPTEAANLSVVEVSRPGTYTSADRSRKVTVKDPVIYFETFGAGAAIFYWDHGRYRTLVVSE